MKAIFKPEDANRLIVRDADINEASLIMNFLGKIKNGASLDAQATYNGNYETNGILFTITEAEKEVDDAPVYVQAKASVVNDELNFPVFQITISPASTNYTSYRIDAEKWSVLKDTLEGLGITELSIAPNGVILGNNDSGYKVVASIVIPRGLFQYVNALDSTVNNFNDSIRVTLGA